MDEGNLAILVDAKAEYTKQLINIIKNNIYNGIKSLYQDAKQACIEEENESNVLHKFQIYLSEIPKWNQDVINGEYDMIIQNSNCDWLEDLITAVFVSHTRILTSINFSKNKKKINLKIPKVQHFIHQCYIDVARCIWKSPYLFDDSITKFDYQRNRRDIESIIENCIGETIRKQLPVRHILKEYLGNEFDEEEEEADFDSENVPSKYRENLRKMVQTEIKNISKEKDEFNIEESLEEVSDNSKDLAEASAEVSNEVSSEVSSEVSNEASTEVSSDVSAEVSSEVSNEVSADVSSEVSPKVSADVSSEVSTEVSNEASTEVSSEVSNEVSPKVSAEVSNEASPKVSAEVSSEVSSEVSPKVSADVSSEVSPEVLADVSSEVSNNLSTKPNISMSIEEEPKELKIDTLDELDLDNMITEEMDKIATTDSNNLEIEELNLDDELDSAVINNDLLSSNNNLSTGVSTELPSELSNDLLSEKEPASNVKTVVIDTNEDLKKNVLKKYVRKRDYSFFDDE